MEPGRRSFGLLVLVLLTYHVPVTSYIVSLDVDLTEYTINNISMPIFRCALNSVGQNDSYYLDHLITWSKIGRDGREKYLSINWDLTIHGKNGQYVVSSERRDADTSTSNSVLMPESGKLYFLLTKPGLTKEDHGEYICRLHDFDKNLLAEASVPVIMFDKGLALFPYKTDADSNTDVAVNCMFNTSGLTSSKDNDIILSHITQSRKPKKIVSNGKLINKSLASFYSVSAINGTDQLNHTILTIKSISKKDNGHIKCELLRKNKVIAETTATIAVDTPKLIPTPTFYLQMPVDSIAHFHCECAEEDVKSCMKHSMAWTFTSKHTGKSTLIYKNGNITADPSLYEVIRGQNGSSNLTINGLRNNFSDGEYICWLHKKGSSTEISHASIPVSVTPISMGVLSLMEGYPGNIKMLCTVTGTRWNNHYLETHSIGWHVAKNGTKTSIAVNSAISPEMDPNKYSVIYYSTRYYAILIVRNLTDADHGDYSCQLKKNINDVVIKEETVYMYGKGNTTIFAGSYTTKKL